MPILLAPVRREVRVRVPVAVAFDAFTHQIGTWWPLSAGGGPAVFAEGRLVQGEQVWAEVITWDRPRAMRLAWRHDGDQRTNVDLRFVMDGEAATIVRVVHDGWERVTQPAAAAKHYGGDRGWREVLQCFGAAVARS
ncbi:hypothetical protein BH11MYX3_BH11MYX3_15910 [soil metagenome]